MSGSKGVAYGGSHRSLICSPIGGKSQLSHLGSYKVGIVSVLLITENWTQSALGDGRVYVGR